tara:strand:+ start:31391 stop:32074 length:684 start_codon:yes stop_codon:yes gene_type:complete
MAISVIIPALNEEKSIKNVINDIPKIYREIIVVDNGSSDKTSEIALENGATVILEEKRGYGYACLKGIDFLKRNPPDIVVFLDGDYSDYPEEMVKLITPINDNKVDFVLGTRLYNLREKGSMTTQQIFGNLVACFLMNFLYNSKFTDLGPFRAIRWNTLISLNMVDKTYGWTVEMQLKILKKKIPYSEINVRYKKRIGDSKISGTLKGTILAGVKIIGWILKYYLKK